MLRAGASGFLLEDTRPEELLAGSRAVAAGDAVISPAATRRLLDTVADQLDSDLCWPVRKDSWLDSLTGREPPVNAPAAHRPRST